MSTQLTSTLSTRSTVVYQRGPSLLVRFIWWLFIGWWASGIAVGVAWVALITIIGIPLGIRIVSRLTSIPAGLRSRRRSAAGPRCWENSGTVEMRPRRNDRGWTSAERARGSMPR
jgi:uncharacterized membrane protein YccF (DUF307 family)